MQQQHPQQVVLVHHRPQGEGGAGAAGSNPRGRLRWHIDGLGGALASPPRLSPHTQPCAGVMEPPRKGGLQAMVAKVLTASDLGVSVAKLGRVVLPSPQVRRSDALG